MALMAGRRVPATEDHDKSGLTNELGRTMNDEQAAENDHKTLNRLLSV